MKYSCLRWCGLVVLLALTMGGCARGFSLSGRAASGSAPVDANPAVLDDDGPTRPDKHPPVGGEVGVAASAAGASESPLAFHGLGKLAFVRDGRLYILAGETDTLRQVEGAKAASPSTWSGDGKWLAFMQGDGTGRRLMVAEAATGQAREVTGLPGPVIGYAWSPVGSSMAVSSAVDGRSGAPVTDEQVSHPGEIWLMDDPARFQGLWRTEDGGRTWTRVDASYLPGSRSPAANSPGI